jgi:hypothetical protein
VRYLLLENKNSKITDVNMSILSTSDQIL